MFLLAVAAIHGVSWGQTGYTLTYEEVSDDECKVTKINITGNPTADEPLMVTIPEIIGGKTVIYVSASGFSISDNGSWEANSIILVLKNLPEFNNEFDVDGLKEIVVKGTVPDGLSDFEWFYQVDDEERITTVNSEYQEQEDVPNLRYVRTLSDKWQPLFVPFSADWTGKGVQIAELAGAESTADGEVLQWTTVTETEANRPYIIRKNGTVTSPIELEDVTVTLPDTPRVDSYYDYDEGEDKEFAVPSNRYTYKLHGTYKEIWHGNGTSNDAYDYESGTWYAMYEGNFWRAGESAILSAQRFYLTVIDKNTGETIQLPASTRVMVDGEVVGIIEHFFEPELLIDDNYYDVLGRRIDNPQPGQLYIHQGKKIIYSDQPTTDY